MRLCELSEVAGRLTLYGSPVEPGNSVVGYGFVIAVRRPVTDLIIQVHEHNGDTSFGQPAQYFPSHFVSCCIHSVEVFPEVNLLPDNRPR